MPGHACCAVPCHAMPAVPCFVGCPRWSTASSTWLHSSLSGDRQFNPRTNFRAGCEAVLSRGHRSSGHPRRAPGREQRRAVLTCLVHTGHPSWHSAGVSLAAEPSTRPPRHSRALGNKCCVMGIVRAPQEPLGVGWRPGAAELTPNSGRRWEVAAVAAGE